MTPAGPRRTGAPILGSCPAAREPSPLHRHLPTVPRRRRSHRGPSHMTWEARARCSRPPPQYPRGEAAHGTSAASRVPVHVMTAGAVRPERTMPLLTTESMQNKRMVLQPPQTQPLVAIPGLQTVNERNTLKVRGLHRFRQRSCSESNRTNVAALASAVPDYATASRRVGLAC